MDPLGGAGAENAVTGWPPPPAAGRGLLKESGDESGDSRGEEFSAKCNDWVMEGMVQRQVQHFGRR